MARVFINDKFVGDIKIAADPQSQAKGLMGVDWPPHPLLFPYKTSGVRKFWMKNTASPLDIIFCRANEVIYIGEGEPFNAEDLVGPDDNCDLVLEFPKGFVAQANVGIGSKVRVKYSKDELLDIMKNGSPKFKESDDQDRNAT